MVPIYEQGNGKGIGYAFDSFRKRFDEICEDHASSNRAASFAFIFYQFNDNTLKSILRDHGVFTQLDRLCGKDLSLFYLHNPNPFGSNSFNDDFQSRLGISSSAPCVVFFNYSSGSITDITVKAIDTVDKFQGFHVLHEIISEHINQQITAHQAPGKWQSFRTNINWITKEAISEIVKESIERGHVLDLLIKVLRLT